MCDTPSWCSALPGFSKIRGDAPGKEGAEGSKFTRYCSFSRQIRDKLPKHNFRKLCENVILSDRSEVDFSPTTWGSLR